MREIGRCTGRRSKPQGGLHLPGDVGMAATVLWPELRTERAIGDRARLERFSGKRGG
jgi:hypothetical protein